MEIDITTEKANNKNAFTSRNNIIKPTINELNEEKYNVNKIIDHLKTLSGREIAYEVGKLLKEKKV